jgi:hypothetical protein
VFLPNVGVSPIYARVIAQNTALFIARALRPWDPTGTVPVTMPVPQAHSPSALPQCLRSVESRHSACSGELLVAASRGATARLIAFCLQGHCLQVSARVSWKVVLSDISTLVSLVLLCLQVTTSSPLTLRYKEILFVRQISAHSLRRMTLI